MYDTTDHPIDWKIEDNNAFYDEIRPEGLQALSIKAGLATGCDIKLLKPYWEQAEKILEVGCGFGRVIENLLTNGFQGEITAIERNPSMYQFTNAHYHDKIHAILNTDVFELDHPKAYFDVIFFLWSGLADTPPHRQTLAVKILASLLNKTGRLILDTMPMHTQPLDTEVLEKQSFQTKAAHSAISTYEANYDEMNRYAAQSGLSLLKLLHCKTDNNRERWLYVLTR